MTKKLLSLALAVIMCFSLVACGGNAEEKAWNEKVIGSWIAAPGYDEAFEDGVVFKEDGTCIVDGKEFDWEFEDTFNEGLGADFYLKDGKNVVYKAQIYTQDAGYRSIQIAEVEGKGGNKIFNFLNGLYYRESDFEKVEVNMNNWQKYFEFKEGKMTTQEDAFGDVINGTVQQYLVVKDEYASVIPDLSKVGVEMTHIPQNYKYTVDFANKTYIKGEAEGNPSSSSKSTSTMSNIPVGDDVFKYGTFAGSLSFDKEPEDVATNNMDKEITRIEGVFYYCKAE